MTPTRPPTIILSLSLLFFQTHTNSNNIPNNTIHPSISNTLYLTINPPDTSIISSLSHSSPNPTNTPHENILYACHQRLMTIPSSEYHKPISIINTIIHLQLHTSSSSTIAVKDH